MHLTIIIVCDINNMQYPGKHTADIHPLDRLRYSSLAIVLCARGIYVYCIYSLLFSNYLTGFRCTQLCRDKCGIQTRAHYNVRFYRATHCK